MGSEINRRSAFDTLFAVYLRCKLKQQADKTCKVFVDMSHFSSQAVTVYGALRSGTTLLHLMLDANPNIASPGETDFIYDHLEQLPNGNWGYESDKIKADRIYRMHFTEHDPVPETAADMIDTIAAKNNKDGAVPVMVQHRRLPIILDQFPDMRIIHLVRDPRDVARSSIGMGWAGDVYHGVGHWIGTERGWDAAASRLAPEQSITVTFTQLIAAPEETLTRLCDFIGVPYHPDMLNYDAQSTYQKPDAALVDQWKSKMSAREIGLVEGRVGDLLTSRGFEPSGHPLVQPGAAGRTVMSLRNKAAVWRVRAKRYGLVDSLTVATARRLGASGLAQNAQRRIDDRVRAYLK